MSDLGLSYTSVPNTLVTYLDDAKSIEQVNDFTPLVEPVTLTVNSAKGFVDKSEPEMLKLVLPVTSSNNVCPE